MKQFDLKEYLKDPNKKVVTRDGRNVRIICTDRKGTEYSVIALCTMSSGSEDCYFYFPNGRMYLSADHVWIYSSLRKNILHGLIFINQKMEYMQIVVYLKVRRKR